MTQDEMNRKAAEQEYANMAFNYAETPIGSRDFILFWRGYRAALEYERNRDKWVSVSERLPDQGEEVLVWIRSRDDSYITVNCVGSEDWSYVTHWQELPAAPKGERT